MARRAFPDVDLMLFPELYLTAVDGFTSGGSGDWERRVAEEIPGPLTDRVGEDRGPGQALDRRRIDQRAAREEDPQHGDRVLARRGDRRRLPQALPLASVRGRRPGCGARAGVRDPRQGRRRDDDLLRRLVPGGRARARAPGSRADRATDRHDDARSRGGGRPRSRERDREPGVPVQPEHGLDVRTGTERRCRPGGSDPVRGGRRRGAARSRSSIWIAWPRSGGAARAASPGRGSTSWRGRATSCCAPTGHAGARRPRRPARARRPRLRPPTTGRGRPVPAPAGTRGSGRTARSARWGVRLPGSRRRGRRARSRSIATPRAPVTSR